jgi:hypothetical protein
MVERLTTRGLANVGGKRCFRLPIVIYHHHAAYTETPDGQVEAIRMVAVGTEKRNTILVDMIEVRGSELPRLRRVRGEANLPIIDIVRAKVSEAFQGKYVPSIQAEKFLAVNQDSFDHMNVFNPGTFRDTDSLPLNLNLSSNGVAS